MSAQGNVRPTAAATPLCSCGTTAVVLGMMASTMPWAPILAFKVASPLSSPEGFVCTAGLFGWPFAIGMFASSVLLGLAGGAAALVPEKRGWLRNQARMTQREARPATENRCGCSAAAPDPAPRTVNVQFAMAAGDCCAALPVKMPTVAPTVSRAVPSDSTAAGSFDVVRLLSAIFDVAKRLMPMFLGFAFIGYFLNGLIPQSWVTTVFGGGNADSVPLAATLGLPPMAFLITGAGTSIGAIVGALTIARWRVVGLVVARAVGRCHGSRVRVRCAARDGTLPGSKRIWVVEPVRRSVVPV